MFKESGANKKRTIKYKFLSGALASFLLAVSLSGCNVQGSGINGESKDPQTTFSFENQAEKLLTIKDVEVEITGTNPNILKLTLDDGSVVYIEFYRDQKPIEGGDKGIIFENYFLLKTIPTEEPQSYKLTTYP